MRAITATHRRASSSCRARTAGIASGPDWTTCSMTAASSGVPPSTGRVWFRGVSRHSGWVPLGRAGQ
jgi:hypothetical protein